MTVPMMKRILATCFFPAFDPPASGGEQKLLRFYSALSAHFDIDLVTWTYPTRSETIRHTDRFREHRVARHAPWDALSASLQAQGYAGELSGVLGAMMAQGASEFRAVLERHWDAADIVMHDFPYSYAQDPFPQDRSKLRIYNSHNFETAITRSVFSGPDDALHDMVERLEGELCRSSDLVLATSTLEALALSLVHEVPQDRIRVMPLGFDPLDIDCGRPADPPFCLFIGSQHPPNIRAAHEVVALAHAMPDLSFVIAGAVGAHLGPVPSNVSLPGVVSSEIRRRLFREAACFVNPMRDGAGMNVKLAEALGAGLPVVTTALGARGFDALGPRMYLAEDTASMVEVIRSLLSSLDGENETAGDEGRQALRHAAIIEHGWPALAARCADWIDEALSCHGLPADLPLQLNPITLFVNDYPLGDGAAGGQKRMLDLISATPTPGPKVLLTLTGAPHLGLIERAPGFVEINIPKTAAQHAFERVTQAHNTMSVADIASAMYVGDNPLFLRWFDRMAQRAGTVVFEHCYLAPLLDRLPSGEDAPQICYSAHNVEADLKAAMLQDARHTHTAPLAALVPQLEAACLARADRVMAVSQEDADRLQALYGLATTPTVVANGTRVPAQLQTAGRQPPAPDSVLELIFIGSAHPPNVGGLRDFLDDVLPLLPQVRLTVVGSVCLSLQGRVLPPSVHLAGSVSEAEKSRLLAAAHVAINPVTLGGGSSLKIGDFLCAGLPVVTTPVGIRGFDLKDGESALVAEMGEPFAAAIERLRQSPELWQRLAAAGEAYGRATLDWLVLGQQAAALIVSGSARLYQPPHAVLVVAADAEAALADPGLFNATGPIDLVAPGDPAIAHPALSATLRSLRLLPSDDDKAAALALIAQVASLYDRIVLHGPEEPLLQETALLLGQKNLPFDRLQSG